MNIVFIMRSTILDFSFWYRVYSLCKRGNVTTLSASLAYYMLFSLFPALLCVRSVVVAFPSVYKPLEALLESRLPHEVAAILGDVFLNAEKSGGGGVFAGGVLISLFALTRFIRSLKIHLERVSGTNSRHSYIGSWLFSVAMALSALLLLFLSLVVIVFGEQILKLLAGVFHTQELFVLLWEKARIFALLFLLVIFLVLLFSFLPERKGKLLHVLPGVLFTSLGWTVSSLVFSFYVNTFARRSFLYAALGGFVILISWLYVLSLVVLIGANINTAFSEKLG